MKQRIVLWMMLVLAASAWTGTAAAQEAAPPPEPLTVEQLKLLLDEQVKLVNKQAERLARQEQALLDQKAEVDSQRATLLAMQTQIDQLASVHDQGVSPEEIELRERLVKLEDIVANEPDEPTDPLADDEFPGAIRVPGTNAALKFGGYVKAALVRSFDPLITDDRFIVAGIPPAGEAPSGSDTRLHLSARQSRLNLDVRQKTSEGPLRAFIEADFAGQGGDLFRLRHAYGQFGGIVAGQTWSTAVDNVAVPEEIDFEGLSARVQVRQPLGRYTFTPRENLRVSLALEDPAPDVTGGGGVSQIPDLIVQFRRLGLGRHVQSSVIVRQIRAQWDEDPDMKGSALGWGLSLSRKFSIRRWDARDNLLFQFNVGDGIGRYINDLGSAGGQDAVFDPDTGELKTLPVIAGYVAFQHWWKPNWRSTFVYSLVNVNNLDIQQDAAYDRTQRSTVNLLWSPIPSIDLGAEVLWGERRNKDGSSGTAMQTQIAVKYLF